jgi:NitT/TauT family transport system ATP-binding protein
MDEPFGALDAQMRETLQEELLRIHEETRKTIIFVTHNIQESIFLGSRLIVLNKGKRGLVADMDIPEEVKKDRTSKEFRIVERKVRGYLS